MHYAKKLIAGHIVFGTLFLLSSVADAQISPGGGMGPGMGGPASPAGEEKKEGVAEAAPKTAGLLPTTPALPAPKGRRKRWKLLELDGYFRMRTDWFKNFNEGFPDRPDLGGSPFVKPLGCTDSSTVHTDRTCDDSLASTNMRLRLEPTLNIDEGTSIHVQADVLDNLVLGSTPTGTDLTNGAYTTLQPPLTAFGGNQAPPVKGQNSDRDSIQIKRAWAEVAVPLGIIKVGRMPNHWGMGIMANGGGADPINGTYDYDGDYGDTVDRASFSMLIPGTSLRGMIAADYPATRLVSNQTIANRGNEGHPFDLDDSDDVKSYVGVLSHMDSPQEFRDAVDRGDLAVNYGVYFEYKTQAWDDNLSADYTGVGGNFNTLGQNFVPRGFKQYMPDLWGKLGIGQFTVEAEVVAQLGTIDHLDDYNNTALAGASVDIRRFGGVGRLTWKGLDGKLRLGIESGFATGGQSDNSPPGSTNIAYANPFAGLTESNNKLTAFGFNREYKVDMILWRHLYGAVTNAFYIKPSLQYDLTKNIAFKVSNITSFAMKPVSTPGNGRAYGTEFDSDLGFSSGGLFAGISYGVLFPFAALNHPEGTAYGFSTDSTTGVTEVGDATTSHCIQLRLVLGF